MDWVGSASWWMHEAVMRQREGCCLRKPVWMAWRDASGKGNSIEIEKRRS